MSEKSISQPYASEEVEQMITRGTPPDSGEIVLGEVDEPFSEGRRFASVRTESLAPRPVSAGGGGWGRPAAINSILLQLAFDGEGFCYIDPKGEGAVDLLQRLPTNRFDDVVLVGRHHLQGRMHHGFDLLETPENKATPDRVLIMALLDVLTDYHDPRIEGQLYHACGVASKLDIPFAEIQQVFDMDNDDFDDTDVSVGESAREWVADIDPDDEDLYPLLRRIQWLSENPALRSIFSPDSTSIYDAVDNNQIIIGVATTESRSVKQVMATGLLGKLYDVLISSGDGRERIYPVVIDDMDSLDIPTGLVETYVSEARTYRAPLIPSIQYPEQMSYEDQEHFFHIIDNWLCFRQANIQAANELKPRLGIENRDQLLNLNRHETFAKLQGVDGEYIGKIQTLPLIKPRRSESDISWAIDG
jgi:hypothetical protein